MPFPLRTRLAVLPSTPGDEHLEVFGKAGSSTATSRALRPFANCAKDGAPHSVFGAGENRGRPDTALSG